MRVLWVCNIMPQIIGQYLKCEYSVKEGWISGILGSVLQIKEVELGICYPVLRKSENKPLEIQLSTNTGEKKIIKCYEFFEDTVNPHRYGGSALEEEMKRIIDDFQPLLLHIFGTEFGHALAAARVFHNKDKILVGLQGIISICAKEYMAGLPKEVYTKATLRDILKKDKLLLQQEKFHIRGEREKELLQIVKNVTGRTEFDKNAVLEINDKLTYYHMNESMRSDFYVGKWNYQSCRKHTIFFSQADYPLKGFHILLEAAIILREQYPDLKIRVAGNSIVNDKTFKDKIKISAYGKYLLGKMKQASLEKSVLFLGKLNATEMKEEYLKSHVYVCASSIENSPNSMAEAMLLGTPVVASRTGGIPSLITHEREGLLFEKENASQLAAAIARVWSEENLRDKLSENARERAAKAHDLEENCRVLLSIYKGILYENNNDF